MLKNVEIMENEKLEVGYWRGQFDELYAQVPNFERKQLAVYDRFFLTAVGKDCVRNVKAGKAGLKPTMKVVEALKKILADKANSEEQVSSVKRRQKLVLPS